MFDWFRIMVAIALVRVADVVTVCMYILYIRLAYIMSRLRVIIRCLLHASHWSVAIIIVCSRAWHTGPSGACSHWSYSLLCCAWCGPMLIGLPAPLHDSFVHSRALSVSLLAEVDTPAFWPRGRLHADRQP